MPPPHASNLAYYTPKTRAPLRSKSHTNVVKLAKHSDFFDLSYERSGKKVEAKKYYTSHAAHWVIKFRRDCLYYEVVQVDEFSRKGYKIRKVFRPKLNIRKKII